MPTTQDALARAVEFLSAVPVQWRILDARDEEPDKGARYDYEPTGLPLGFRAEAVRFAFVNGTTGAWATFTNARRERESKTVFDPPAIPMPSWWTPTQRFAFACGIDRVPQQKIGPDSTAQPGWNRITADLETGAEVPA